MRQKLTADRLRELLSYDQETGVFTRIKARPKVRVGDIAGTVHPRGCIYITILGNNLLAHRLAWMYVYGKMPNRQIDHINGNRADNRIANLREATQEQNMHNRSLLSNGATGKVGVTKRKRTGRYEVRIQAFGIRQYVGGFSTAEEAAAAYAAAKLTEHTFIDRAANELMGAAQ